MYLGPGFILWWNKIFDFHLLKLSRSEDEITRCDLITKCLAYLRYAKGNLRLVCINKKVETLTTSLNHHQH